MKLFTKLALSLSLAFMLHAADLQFNVLGTADTAMTATEQKAIGVDKMSKANRDALDKWIRRVLNSTPKLLDPSDPGATSLIAATYGCGMMSGVFKLHPEARAAMQDKWDALLCDQIEKLVAMLPRQDGAK